MPLGKLARYQTANLIQNLYGDQFEVHCLGSTQWVHEALLLANHPGPLKVRSMDTCMPIVLGLQEQVLESGVYTGRPENYFNIAFEHLSSIQWRKIYDNCRTLLRWAEASPSGV